MITVTGYIHEIYDSVDDWGKRKFVLHSYTGSLFGIELPEKMWNKFDKKVDGVYKGMEIKITAHDAGTCETEHWLDYSIVFYAIEIKEANMWKMSQKDRKLIEKYS